MQYKNLKNFDFEIFKIEKNLKRFKFKIFKMGISFSDEFIRKNSKKNNSKNTNDYNNSKILKCIYKNLDPYNHYEYSYTNKQPYINYYRVGYTTPTELLNKCDELKSLCNLESIKFPIKDIQRHLYDRFTYCLLSDLEKFPKTNNEIFGWFFGSNNITSFIVLLNTYQFKKDFYIQLLLLKLYSLQLFLKEIKFSKSTNERCKLYLTKMRELVSEQKEEIFNDIDNKIAKNLEMLENKEETYEFNDMIHNLDHRSYFTVMDSQNIELEKLIIQKYCSIKITITSE